MVSGVDPGGAIGLPFGTDAIPPPSGCRPSLKGRRDPGARGRSLVSRVTTELRIDRPTEVVSAAATDVSPRAEPTAPWRSAGDFLEVTVPAGRDLRLDFFRGLALFCIFIDHLPENLLARFTLQSAGLSDAAEVFILISGYAAGMVYGGVCERQGLLWAGARIYHRVWQLYVAHAFVFMLFIATVAHSASRLNSALFAEELRAADFLKEPDVAVVKALTLQFQPAFMDILPLYIVLLAALPLVLAGFRRWPLAVLAGSGLLWLSAQLFDGVALRAYPGPDHTWFFNPFAWQALFFLSAWLGWHGRRGLPRWVHSRWILFMAVAIALGAFVVRTSSTLHQLSESVPALFVNELWPLASKTDLGPVRFVNVLALALLVARLVKPHASYLAGPVARPFVRCGRHSLHVFCLGILLTVVGRLVIDEYVGGNAMVVVTAALGIAMMIGMASLMDWFQGMPARPHPIARRGGP
jgi:hypothetical protein